MSTVRTLHRLAAGIALSLLCGAPSALAIEQDQPFLMESWTLAPGSVFEILAVSEVSDRLISWSLTKADGSFVQADRGPLFRERFAEAGDFLLRGEVSAVDQTPVTQRTFAIHIIPGTPPLTSGTGGSFITTDPPSDADGTAIIGTNLQTILVRTQAGAVQPSVDVNGEVDTNGDGDASNDNDTRGTFFETDGSALRLWFTDGLTQRTLTIRGSGTNGPVTQTIRLYAGSAPPTTVEPPEETPISSPSGLESVHIEDRDNGTYAFSINSSTLSTEGRAILLYWDFGDGRQSMLDRPVHTYAQNGQYTVSLQARDLATTEEVLRITGILPVSTVHPPAQLSSASSNAANSSSSSSSSAGPSRFSLRSIATIGGGLLLAIFVGFAVVTLVGKIVQKKLDNAPPPPAGGKPAKKSPPPAGLPSLDQPPPLSVVYPEQNRRATDVAPPMAVIDVTPAPQAEEKPEVTAEPPAPKEALAAEPAKLSELTFQEEEAPSWLKQGHEEAEKRGHTVETALPEVQEPKKETEAPAQPTGKESRPLPPWLEPAAQAPVEAPAAPSAPAAPPPAPAPVAPPAPPPASAPEPAPVAAPAPAPEPVAPPPEPIKPPSAALSTPPTVPPQKAAVATPSPTPSAPKDEAKQELTEAERERRRKKRARYRQNKKMREEATEQGNTPQEPSPTVKPKPAEATPAPLPTKSTPAKKLEPPTQQAQKPLPAEKIEETDAPIAIIRADNISQDQKKS